MTDGTMTPADELELLRLRAQALKARSTGGGTPVGKSEDPGLGEVVGGMISNAPESTGQLIMDTVTPFTDPKGTIKGIAKAGIGAVEKLIPGEQEYEKNADAVGAHFKERYHDWPAIKRTMRDDPAGFFSDATIPLTGGGSALARAPGIIGKVGKAAQIAGKVEPISAAVGGVKLAAKATPHVVGEILTGTGVKPLQTAYEAGKTGGVAEKELTTSMRDGGDASKLATVDEARGAMAKGYAARSAAYTKNMSPIAGAKPPSANVFQSIGRAAGKALNQSVFNGHDFLPKTYPVRKEIYDTVVKWGNMDPATMHTAEGLDKMKREIGGIRDEHQLGTPNYKAANDVYKAVEGEIENMFPEYKEAMKEYAQQSKMLGDLSKTLSLGHKATDDAALRKIQSSQRGGVATNYGARSAMIDELDKYSPGLKQRVAGQSLSSVTPRGLSKYLVPSMAGPSAIAAGIANPLTLIPSAFMAAASSPRIAGETALALGKGARAVNKIPSPVRKGSGYLLTPQGLQAQRQLGMLNEEEDF